MIANDETAPASKHRHRPVTIRTSGTKIPSCGLITQKPEQKAGEHRLLFQVKQAAAQQSGA